MSNFEYSNDWSNWADIYDNFWSDLPTSSEVEFITNIVGDGSTVVDMGAGTGRIALSLLQNVHAINVIAVDISHLMLERLQERQSQIHTVGSLEVIQADMSSVDFGSRQVDFVWFGLSSFFSLPTPEAQLRCLQNCADALSPSGTVGMSLYVPSPTVLPPGDAVQIREFGPGAATLSATRNNTVEGWVEYREIILADNALPRVLSERQSYLMPEQLDQMAKHAGLSLVARYADFDMSAFADTSPAHVSIYQLDT